MELPPSQGGFFMPGTRTPFEVLAEAVEELRFRPILKQRHPGGAERALSNVDLYLEMALPYDVRGLGAFAADMREKWENSEAEIEGRPDAEEQAVRLITMHSAKGLEWPIVIPVNTMTTPQATSGLLLHRNTNTAHYYIGPVRDAISSSMEIVADRADVARRYSMSATPIFSPLSGAVIAPIYGTWVNSLSTRSARGDLGLKVYRAGQMLVAKTTDNVEGGGDTARGVSKPGFDKKGGVS